ncbi:carbohydrate ABC transporter permease [Paenibacillus eucommiae]|uniref:Aldouronate transport system permease protein n=1 Tax=Paenibacillus eucommiae TaxID=1355755 RepID=A0ABS4IUJ7_9BACL|nr:carbohydrate ABC transporter permease [Paenibacillus eucommiae]MBP1990536.1 putative aldouronate transport system permease protein [Paenibacillus eucommiae]
MIREKRTVGSTIFNIINIGFFILFTLICIFPFYYMFINTISDNYLAATGKILLIPKGIHLKNYAEIFSLPGLGQAAFISISRTIIGTLLTLIGSAFLGYAYSRKEYWMRKFWYRFVIISLYFNAGIIPWFIMMKNLGMINNFWAYILPTVVSGFYVILFKTYVESLPASLEESAQIDGAGYMVRFSKIILPLSAPILATIAVFASVAQWNSFMDTLFLIRSSKLFTLQFLLYQYLNQVNVIAEALKTSTHPSVNPFELTPISIRMTISIVVVLPIMLVYPFLQRFFIKGILLGAVKG